MRLAGLFLADLKHCAEVVHRISEICRVSDRNDGIRPVILRNGFDVRPLGACAVWCLRRHSLARKAHMEMHAEELTGMQKGALSLSTVLSTCLGHVWRKSLKRNLSSMYVRHLLICAFVARMAAFHASLQAKSSMDLEFQGIGIGLAEIVWRGWNPSFCAVGSEFGCQARCPPFIWE